MMESTDIVVDPEYEERNVAIKKIENNEQESKLTNEKIFHVLQNEFDKELKLRQKQIEDIEDKIFKAQKLLHAVRYAVVSSYYNTKALEYNDSIDGTLEGSNILSGQNRIHPAVKKLIGKNVTNLSFLNTTTKRRCDKKEDNVTNNHQNYEPPIKKLKHTTRQETDNKYNENNTNSIIMPTSYGSTIQTNRKKIEHLIIVGNISYYKKSLEQDILTHKWMLYIRIYRGTREGPEVSNMIQRVVFFLHPSYKPDDVVEISELPFNLSRRGWGEFPVRIQIFFKSHLNKPVDVVHNLKLEKTFVGRQTVGNETIVPVYLHDDVKNEYVPLNVPTKSELNDQYSLSDSNMTAPEHNYCFDDNINGDIKTESVIKKEEEITVDEHNYFYENVAVNSHEVKENGSIYVTKVEALCDHDYCRHSGMHSVTELKNVQYINEEPHTDLIYGVNDSYLNMKESPKLNNTKAQPNKYTVRTITTRSGKPIQLLPESVAKVLLNRGGGFIHVSLLPNHQTHTVLSPVDSKGQIFVVRGHAQLKNGNRFEVKVPEDKFKSMGELLPYLFKRVPLWSNLTHDHNFQSLYPFVAQSYDEYSQWNVGKRLSSEWSRAKTIKRLLKSLKCVNSEKWTTKAIFMYGRSHALTPLVTSYRLFQNDSAEKQLLTNCFSDVNSRKSKAPTTIDFPVDIENDTDTSNSTQSTSCVDISDENLKYQCSFVKEAALDCGIILKCEQIADGVIMNGAERMMLEALKCFAENLIRRARHHLICSETFRCDSPISTREINIALNERSEFRTISIYQHKRKEAEFFS